MQRTLLPTGLLALALALAACDGAAVATPDAGPSPASGTCLEGTPDCDDTAGQVEPVGDVYDSETAIAQAQALLGRTEAELTPDVRIGRRDEEQMMLTEDYVLGRMTVELDLEDRDADTWIVTSVTVELPDAPQTFTHDLS